MEFDPGDGQGFPAIVSLNVGGAGFTTSLETLQGGFSAGDGDSCGGQDRVSGSMLGAMFSGRIPPRKDSEGRYFIDRDGRHFHHILNYLRDGTFPPGLPPVTRLEVAREASFFGLEALAAHLKDDLRTPGGGCDGSDPSSLGAFAGLSAQEVSEQVLNRCLEDWPDFLQYVRTKVLQPLLLAGGVPLPEVAGAATPQAGVPLDEISTASLREETLAAVQVELAHVTDSKAWRWSDRKTGVNSVIRAKLLRCHLQRLGYSCRILPLMDKKEVSAYVLQVELPMPS